MSKLRKSARGKHCTLRIPGVCNGNPETTVLCHIRLPGTGIGRKPPDWQAVYGCSNCHDAFDGRGGNVPGNWHSVCIAWARTLEIMNDKGLIKL